MTLKVVTIILCFLFIFKIEQSSATEDDNARPSGAAYDPSSNGSNLTDQDKITSETYIHEGISQDRKNEGCGAADGSGSGGDPEMQAACQGREQHLLGNMVPMLIKAYAVVIGAGLMGQYEVTKAAPATGGTTEAGAQQPASGQQQTEQKEKKDDYCKYIPMATEALAMFQQMSAQQNLQNAPGNNDNLQTEQLYKAKRTHEERATNAKIQAGGWFAGAACYGITIATGGYADWTMWLKLGLSGLAGTYYVLDAAKQEEYAKKIQTVIDSMPKAGYCNPITERHCFCSQESSKVDMGNYLKHCKAQVLAEQRQNQSQVACIDKQAKADPNCNCLNNNSCFDVEFMSMVGGLKFGKTAEEVLKRPLQDASRGKINSSDLDASTFVNNARSRLKSVASKLPFDKAPKSKNVNSALLDSAGDLGIPRSILALAVNAKNPSNYAQYAEKVKAYEVDTSSLVSYGSRDYGNAKILTFSGGNGNFKKPTSGKSNEFDFNKLLKKKTGGEASQDNILKFADRAAEAAQISKNPDVAIFDIISNRYRVSGWKRVNFE